MKKITEKQIIELAKFPGGGEEDIDTGGDGGNSGGNKIKE